MVLDAWSIQKGESRQEIVENLLDTVQSLIRVDRALTDRVFDSQHILEEIAQRGLIYVIPKRMQTSEKAQARRLLRRDAERYITDRKLYLGGNEWHETTADAPAKRTLRSDRLSLVLSAHDERACWNCLRVRLPLGD